MAVPSPHQDRWRRLEAIEHSNAARIGLSVHLESDDATVGLLTPSTGAPASVSPTNRVRAGFSGSHQQQKRRPLAPSTNYHPLVNNTVNTPPQPWSPHDVQSPSYAQRRPVVNPGSDSSAAEQHARPTSPPYVPPPLVNQTENGYLANGRPNRPLPNGYSLRDIAGNGPPSPPGPPSSRSTPGWPAAAQQVGQAGSSTIVWRLIDAALFLVSLLTIILVISAKIADGKAVDDYPQYQKIIGVTAVYVSIFPIVFAGVVGRTLDAIANWRVEHGTSILFLEQLIGSTTVYNTINVHLRLRTFNLVAVGLFILWSLSPLGGQGILRLITIEDRISTATRSLGYANLTGDNTESVFFTQKGAGVRIIGINSVYRASLIAPNATMSAPQDTWGNIKIPRFEALDPSSKDSHGWVKVPKSGVKYSSLVGIPVGGIPQVGNSSFKIETAYFELSCDDPIKVPSDQEVHWKGQPDESPGLGSIRIPNTTSSDAFDSTFSVGTFTPFTNRFSGFMNHTEVDTSNDDDSPRNINFQSITGTLYSWDVAAVSCTIQTSYVEVLANCIGRNCSVESQRRSTQPRNVSDSFTPWEYPEFAYFFFAAFTQSTGVVSGSSPFWYSTLSEDYVNVESDPLAVINSTTSLIDMSKLNAEQLSSRWARLINTYWITSCVPLLATGAFADYAYGDKRIPLEAMKTTASITTSDRIYRVHISYFILTLVSATVLCVFAALGPCLSFFKLTPDLLPHVSSVTRDNPHFKGLVPAGGSAIGGYERARALKDLKIMVGDVSEHGATVGHIAFAPVTGAHAARPVRKGRLYE